MTLSGETRLLTAIGLMTGTSMDGIDAALIRTDGETTVETGPSVSLTYDGAFARSLRTLLGPEGRTQPGFAAIEAELTDRHAGLVEQLMAENGLSAADIDVVGFHGQTIFHDPARRRTDQIGDGVRLAERLGIDVVADFRANDVAMGGEGAPFAPLYHAALAAGLERPIAVLNLGGVGNVTWLGDGGGILAFDTGPANALMDDWCLRHTGAAFDEHGELASRGSVARAMVATWLEDPYFAETPPKSLDRNSFDVSTVETLSPADGAATLLAFTVDAVARARDHLPAAPARWLVSGGGRHNRRLMRNLGHALEAPVEPVEQAGWDGDALEAQAFAYLAVRSLGGLPLSLPTTTGVPSPATGGRLIRAD